MEPKELAAQVSEYYHALREHGLLDDELVYQLVYEWHKAKLAGQYGFKIIGSGNVSEEAVEAIVRRVLDRHRQAQDRIKTGY